MPHADISGVIGADRAGGNLKETEDGAPAELKGFTLAPCEILEWKPWARTLEPSSAGLDSGPTASLVTAL